jgi:hypothetical protein
MPSERYSVEQIVAKRGAERLQAQDEVLRQR